MENNDDNNLHYPESESITVTIKKKASQRSGHIKAARADKTHRRMPFRAVKGKSAARWRGGPEDRPVQRLRHRQRLAARAV